MPGFRMLDLPIETRLRIYHHFFNIKYRPTDVAWVNVDTKTDRRLVRQDVWPLFETCRQIYDEVMPEYYAWTRFHFNALVTLQETMHSHKHFNAHVRHLVFNPNLLLPEVEDLLQLENLQTFAIVHLACHEPVGTPSGKALEYGTLHAALYRENRQNHHQDKIDRALRLFDALAEATQSRSRPIRLLLRFGYFYIEKTKQPETWGGKTAKRYRVVEYDLSDDVFVIAQPDADENPFIRKNRLSTQSMTQVKPGPGH